MVWHMETAVAEVKVAKREMKEGNDDKLVI